MKFLIILIATLSLQITSFASSHKECSRENLEKLLDLTAKLFSEVSMDNMNILKVLASKETETMTGKEILAQVFKEKKERIKKSESNYPESIMTLVKAHPECDKLGNFTTQKR